MRYNKFKTSQKFKNGIAIVLFGMFTGHTVIPTESDLEISNKYDSYLTLDPVTQLKYEHFQIKSEFSELVENKAKLDSLENLKNKLQYERNRNTVSRSSP